MQRKIDRQESNSEAANINQQHPVFQKYSKEKKERRDERFEVQDEGHGKKFCPE